MDAGTNVLYSVTGNDTRSILTMNNNTQYTVEVMEIYDGSSIRSAKFSVARWNGSLNRVISDAGNSTQITLAANTSSMDLTVSGSLAHSMQIAIVDVRKLGQFPYRTS
jgi:hypothetical protein